MRDGYRQLFDARANQRATPGNPRGLRQTRRFDREIGWPERRRKLSMPRRFAAMREDINHIKHTVRACAFVLAFGVVSHALAAAGCEEWRTPEYVRTATVADVRRCLAAEADQEARNAVLYTAARYNEDPAVVNALVAAGADPNARNRIGETPLHMASILNKAAAIKALLAAGADPHARNNYSETPLVQTQDRAITELLSQAMAARPAGSTVVTVGEGTQARAPEPAGNPGGTAGGRTRSSPETRPAAASEALDLQPASVARDKPAQNLCAPCDILGEKLRIVRAKSRSFEEGLDMLRTTRQELQTNTNIAGGLATTYLILQGVNIAFGLATLPCSIPRQWLKGLLAGAGGLGAYVQGGTASEVTLAAVVSSVGLGVVADTISTYEFIRRYGADSAGLNALRRDLDRTTREFEDAREALARERRTLESDLSKGGCRFDPLDDFLGR